MGAGFVLRDAVPCDAAAVMRLIRALAEYERLAHRCVATDEDMHRVLFGPRPYARAMLAEVAGRAVGVALYHTTISTFTCRPGYFLEDIFVEPEHRGRGIGRAFFAKLATRLNEENGRAIAWRVLKWNTPSIEFYRGLGAEGDPGEWDTMSLSGEALSRLAA